MAIYADTAWKVVSSHLGSWACSVADLMAGVVRVIGLPQTLIDSTNVLSSMKPRMLSRSGWTTFPPLSMNRPELLWSYQTAESDFPLICAAAVDRRAVLVSLYNGDLALLSLDNGAEIWKRKLPVTASTCNVLSATRALVTTLEGHLICIDPETGEDLWINQTTEPIYSFPLVVDGEIYFGSDDHHLYCVDLETGEATFKLQTGSRIRSAPASYHNLIVFGSDDFNVYCFDKDEREIVWTYETKFWVRSSAAIFESSNWRTGSVCVASWMDMVCLDIETGDERWVHPTESEITYKPLIHREYLVFGTRLTTGLVYCLNKDIGSINWFKRYDENSAGQPILYSRDSFLLKYGSSIVALNLHDGSEHWRIERVESCVPLVTRGRLLFCAHKSLLCYDLFNVK